jgi:general secretion pathway protein L
MNASMQMWRDTAVRLWQHWPLSRLCRWWLGELAAMVPVSMRHRLSHDADWHVIEWMEGEWQLRRADDAMPLASWSDALAIDQQQAIIGKAFDGTSPDTLRLVLLVPGAWGLRRRIAFPVASRDRLEQAAVYEIDRQTPFRAAQVFHALGGTTLAANGTRLQTDLVLVPRAMLEPLLVKLSALGISLDAVDVRLDGGRLGANLLPEGDRPRRVNRRLRLNLCLFAGACILLVLSLLQWLHNREAALQVMRDEVARMQGDVQAVSTLRQTLQDHAGATGFLAQRKKGDTSALSILQELSSRLPQNAWLERLTIDHAGQIGMQGQGAQAASLLEALKGSQSLVEPAFQGSIQKEPSTGKERFYMVAQLRKAAEAKPKAPAAAGSAP